MTAYPYIFRWGPPKYVARKGQRCAVTARGARRTRPPTFAREMFMGDMPRSRGMNSIRVEFPDGFRMITSGNAIRKAKEGER